MPLGTRALGDPAGRPVGSSGRGALSSPEWLNPQVVPWKARWVAGRVPCGSHLDGGHWRAAAQGGEGGASGLRYHSCPLSWGGIPRWDLPAGGLLCYVVICTASRGFWFCSSFSLPPVEPAYKSYTLTNSLYNCAEDTTPLLLKWQHLLSSTPLGSGGSPLPGGPA